ncbi:hypothetical protein F5884DRAFT_884002 [Xylogone sp. PMI_703]|nr:hypothetical protein F5884DRAFT_884002 [Xylogone sp. PMI_703]
MVLLTWKAFICWVTAVKAGGLAVHYNQQCTLTSGSSYFLVSASGSGCMRVPAVGNTFAHGVNSLTAFGSNCQWQTFSTPDCSSGLIHTVDTDNPTCKCQSSTLGIQSISAVCTNGQNFRRSNSTRRQETATCPNLSLVSAPGNLVEVFDDDANFIGLEIDSMNIIGDSDLPTPTWNEGDSEAAGIATTNAFTAANPQPGSTTSVAVQIGSPSTGLLMSITLTLAAGCAWASYINNAAVGNPDWVFASIFEVWKLNIDPNRIQALEVTAHTNARVDVALNNVDIFTDPFACKQAGSMSIALSPQFM